MGYVFLVILGLINQTLYYYFLGINILNYSNILDVLISPLAEITSSLLGFFVLIGSILAIIFLPKFLIKSKHKRWVQKFLKNNANSTDQEIKYAANKTVIIFIVSFYIGLFSGSGMDGKDFAKKIKEDKIEYIDTITFLDNTKLKAKIVGTNSAYIFYLKQGNAKVQISPISGNIKSFEKNKEAKKSS